MYDLKASHFSLSLEKNILTTATITQEGLLLITGIEAGEEVVSPCTGPGGEVFAGFSILDNAVPTTYPVVEEIAVPALAPLTATLSHTNIVTVVNAGLYNEACGYNDTDGQALTCDTTSADNQILLVPVTGGLTFHADEAGDTITMRYRYTLTTEAAKRLFYERNVNNTACATFTQLTVGGGTGEMYTSEYDCGVDWENLGATALLPEAGGSAATAANTSDGWLTVQGGQDACRLIHVPDEDDPRLGVAFDFIP